VLIIQNKGFHVRNIHVWSTGGWLSGQAGQPQKHVIDPCRTVLGVSDG